MTLEDVHNIPCGFPIITEKRSSCNFNLVTTAPSETTVVDSTGFATGSPSNKEGTGSLSNDEVGETSVQQGTGNAAPLHSSPYDKKFRKKIVICNKISSSGKVDDGDEEMGTPFSLTAMDTDCGQNLFAIVTIQYHDFVEKRYELMDIGGGDSGNTVEDEQQSQEEDDSSDSNIGRNQSAHNHTKVLATTTITTVADIRIHISLASEPFICANNVSRDANQTNMSNGSQTQRHQITLSATTSTEEIDEATMNINFNANDDNYDNLFSDYHHNYRYTLSDVKPQITFSSNTKYLACIIPRPMRKRYLEDNESSPISDVESEAGSMSSIVYIKPVRLSALVIFQLEAQTISHGDENEDNYAISINDVWSALPQPTYLRDNQSYSEEQHSGDANERRSVQTRNISSLPPIATNPHTATLDPSKISEEDITVELSRLLTQITCVCNLNHNSISSSTIQTSKYLGTRTHAGTSAPLVLVGCTDGSILVVSYKRATVLGLLLKGHERGNSLSRPISASNRPIPLNSHTPLRASHKKTRDDCAWDNRGTGLCVLKYHVNVRDCYDPKGIIRGRILGVQRDGHLVMYSTSFRSKSMTGEIDEGNDQEKELLPSTDYDGMNSLVWESKKFSFAMAIKPMKGLYANSASSSLATKRYANGTFVDFNTVATLVRPLHASRGQGRDIKFDDLVAQVWSVNQPRIGGATLISEFNMNCEKLEEIQHGVFGNDSVTHPIFTSFGQRIPNSIEYDELTGCLLIASVIPLRRSTRTASIDAKSFMSLWDWRLSTIGLTLASAKSLKFVTKRTGSRSVYPIFLAREFFASVQRLQREAGGISLVHTYCENDSCRNEVYRVGLLSPSRCRKSCRGLDDDNPLFLSKDYVMYPSMLQVRRTGTCYHASFISLLQ